MFLTSRAEPAVVCCRSMPAPGRLRELLAAVAVYAVGGSELLEEKRDELPGAVHVPVCWQIVLKKSFWDNERKFLEPLMRLTRGDMRDHIVSSKIDHGPP